MTPRQRLAADRAAKVRELSAVLAFLRQSAATMLASDIPKLNDSEDRRELETAARAIEVVADAIENGEHHGSA